MAKKFFFPKKKLSSEKDFYVLDVETYTLEATQENLWFGCIYNQHHKFYFETIEQFYKIIGLPHFADTIIYAHNGGRFDWLVIFENLLDGDVVYVGSRFICYKLIYEGNEIVFADSLNIMKASAKEIGKMVGLPKLELKGIGKIKKGTKPSDKHIEYCFRDCEIIYQGLKSIFGENAPKLTIGSHSLDDFQRNFQKTKLVFDDIREVEYTSSYYGGRTEMFKRGKGKYNVYDFNSLYTKMMYDAVFPHPSYSYIVEQPTLRQAKRHLMEKEGMMYCKIFVPEKIKYPPLPYIKDKRLCFCHGYLKGAWTMLEINYALSLGCELLEVYKIVSSSRLITGKELFGDFIDFHYNMRITNPKGSIQEWLGKYKPHNLYGKFGQHNFSSIRYFKSRSECEKFLMSVENYYEYTIHDLKEYSKERTDCYVEKKEKNKLTGHSIVSFAAYITTAGRILLHKTMTKYDPVYVDTDSLFIPVKNKLQPETGSKLGELKLEDYQCNYIHGCKDYKKVEYIYGKAVIKGVGKNSKKIGRNKFLLVSLAQPKTALRRKLPIGKPFEQEKVIKRVYTKGIILKNNFVKPFFIPDTK